MILSIVGLAQTQEMNISYGEHPQQMYDIYFPSSYDADTPVVIFIHGGGWWAPGVQRSRYRPFVEGLFSMGEMIVVNMDYRLVTNGGDTYVFPHQIEDITSVINHLESEYNLNNPITLTGNSAGGHLSLWYYLNQVSEIEKIIPIVAPYKADVMVGDIPYFLHPSNTLLEWVMEQFISPEIVFDTELEKLLYASPHTYANQELDDIFAVFCTADRDVPLHQYEAMQQDYPNIQYQLYGGGHNAWTNTSNAIDLIPKMKTFIMSSNLSVSDIEAEGNYESKFYNIFGIEQKNLHKGFYFEVRKYDNGVITKHKIYKK